MNDSRRDIAGKAVLLSGASGGIGRELVRAFLGAGAAEIIAASRTPDDASDSRVRPHALDVTDDASVTAAAAAFAERVDILVNCAGANANSRIFLPPALEGARDEMDVNYFGLLRMVRAFAPAMQRRRQGTIVNMLSMVSLVNVPKDGNLLRQQGGGLLADSGHSRRADALWHSRLHHASERDRHSNVGPSQYSQA